MKVKKLKILSILFSVLFIFSFLPMSSANAETLTETTQINVTQDLENMQVKDLTTQTERTVLKSEFTKNSIARSIQTEGGTKEFIPQGLPTSISPRSIIETDDRTQITNTSSWPYSAICYIEMEFPNGKNYIGSATMYDKNVAVTAAHCLYSEEDGGWATSVIVVPGMNGNNMPFGYAYATSISAPQGWTKSGSSDYDWGLIKLNTNMGEKTGYFGVYWALTSLNGSNVDITGYPGEKSRTLWKMNGNLTDSSTYRLSYTIDTTGGQSGCPVYWKDSSGHRIVGIHTLGSSSVNSATRVTKSVFDAMMNFI